jgi:hypothetical protein
MINHRIRNKNKICASKYIAFEHVEDHNKHYINRQNFYEYNK